MRACSVTSVVSNSVIPWTIAFQALLSMGFSQQEYWSGLPCPPPGHLPDPGIKLVFSALQEDSLPLSHLGSPLLLFSPTLCDFMDHSSLGFPVSHYLPEFAQWTFMSIELMMLSGHLILCHPFLLFSQSGSLK